MTIKRKDLTFEDYKKIVDNSVLFKAENFGEGKGAVSVYVTSKTGTSKFLIPKSNLPLELNKFTIDYPNF